MAGFDVTIEGWMLVVLLLGPSAQANRKS